MTIRDWVYDAKLRGLTNKEQIELIERLLIKDSGWPNHE